MYIEELNGLTILVAAVMADLLLGMANGQA